MVVYRKVKRPAARAAPKPQVVVVQTPAARPRARAASARPSRPARRLASKLPAGTFKGVGSALGGLAGTFIGGPGIGTMIGSGLGGLAGDLLGHISGIGDYKVSYNTLARNSKMMLSGDSVPAVQNTHSGVRICHREFITDIQSSTSFVNTSFNINPGVEGTFPWLSAVAQNFQQYKLHGMIFSFVSTSADALNSTNTALGTVILGTNYNASQPAFLSKSQMENNEFTTSAKPSQNVMHLIECDPRQTLQEGKFYIRTGSLPANQDIKTYDVGLFQLATQGSQAVATIGELHVSYDIELMKPIDNSATGVGVGYAHYNLSGCSASVPYGTLQTADFDNIGMIFPAGAGATTMNFPSTVIPGQQYFVNLDWYGSNQDLAGPSFTLLNCSKLTIFNNDTATSETTNSTTGPQLITTLVVKISPTANITTPAQIILGTGGTFPGSSDYGDLFVSQIPDNGT